jgi:hypothetical protein
MRESMFDSRGDAQAMGDQHTAMMKHNAQAAEDINGLRKALLATFSAEQKATFDQYAPGPGQWRGMQGRGPGPGFGAGRGGGRGMGYGNCQFAA